LGDHRAFAPKGGKAVPLDGKPIFEASIAMMRRVLDDECTRLIIRRDSIQGEEIARVIMHAFLAGMTVEGELVVLVRNLEG
jgi:hypothetical protein